ncbi:MAG: type VI secretion system tip protein VgrG [Bacteroidota bacterium]
MIAKPTSASTHLVSFKVFVEGQEIKDTFVINSVLIERELNRISKARVSLTDGVPSQAKFKLSETDTFIPGKEIEIQAGYDNKVEPIFKGIIIKHKIKSRNLEGGELTLICCDKAIKMTIGKSSKYFKKEKDSNIMKKLAEDHGLTTQIKPTTIEHPKIVKYYSTDWDFLVTRAEMNGFFVRTENGKVIAEPPSLTKKPVLRVTYGSDVIEIDAELDAYSQLGEVKCESWDIKKQKITSVDAVEPSLNKQGNITAKKMAKALDVGEVKFHTTGPVQREMLKQWANARLMRSRLSGIKGTVVFKGNAKAVPDALIELAGFGDRFNGHAYVSKVVHDIGDGDWVSEVTFGVPEKTFVEQTNDIMSPSASGMLPGIEGLQNGSVKKIEDDPDGETRILVEIPVIEESGVGVWARLASFYASSEHGAFFIPDVGDEVVLGFLNNDPRFPIILGMVYSSKNKAPLTPEKKNREKAIITKSKMKLIFNEEKKEIQFETPNGNKVTLSDDMKGITMEDENKNKIELSKDGIKLTTQKDLILDAKGKVDIKSINKMTLNSTADVSVTGLNIENAAKVNFKAQGNARAELKATGQTSIRGSMVMIN